MLKFIFKIFLGWLVSVVGIYFSSLLLVDFNYDSFLVLALVALFFSITSGITRPLLKLLSLPFPVIGVVFIFVANSFIIFILGIYLEGFHPGNMTTVLEAGVIISLINFVLRLVVK
uniref:Phage holin family protein n=1 Tax=candidate division CPR3 bacterium TaxID=2268181 RepID=A0A7C4R4X0_UNCC3